MSFPEPPASESLPSPPERVDGVEVVFVMLSAPSPPVAVPVARLTETARVDERVVGVEQGDREVVDLARRRRVPDTLDASAGR